MEPPAAAKVLFRCREDLVEPIQCRIQVAGDEAGTRIAAAPSNFNLILAIIHRVLYIESFASQSLFSRAEYLDALPEYVRRRTYATCLQIHIGIEERLIFPPTAAVSEMHRRGRR